MKPYIIYISCLICILTVYVLYSLQCENYKNSDDVPTVQFPFKNLYDDKGEKLNIILIAAPFREKQHEDLYNEYKKKGLSFCGISSYLEFPNRIKNPYEDRYHEKRGHNYPEMVSAWLHCFRKQEYIEPIRHLPHLLLTEADLKDVSSIKDVNEPKEYDFLYCCLADNDECKPGWQSYNRNWDLAKKCLSVMCKKFKLKGLMVGRQNCEYTTECLGIVKTLPLLDYFEFQKELKKSRFLFVPNISDASPRVITEAICYNIPVLVNKNIFGGWHNVIPSITGEVFNDENDIEEVLDRMISINGLSSYQPKKWFKENRGRQHSGKLLSEFLIQNYPNINNKNMKYAYISI